MNVSASRRIDAPRQRVWAALADRDVLVRTLPGCRSVERTGPGTAVAAVDVRAGAVVGTFRLEARVTDRAAPERCHLEVEGASTEGTLRADVDVRLEEDGAATVARVDVEAEAGGTLGAVGGRLLAGVVERSAVDLLEAVAADLAPVATAEPPAVAAEEPVALSPEALAATAPLVDRDGDTGGRAGRRLGRILAAVAAVAGVVAAVVAVLAGRRQRRPARDDEDG